MNAQIRRINLKTSDLVKACAEKGAAASRFIIKQVAKAKGLVKRKMSKVLTLKEAANRDKQFQKIAEKVIEFKDKGLPILSIDTRKEGIYRTILPLWEVLLPPRSGSL